MGNETFSSDFLQVLLALKSNIMQDTHCSNLAIVKSIDSSITCRLLNSDTKIVCTSLQGLELKKDDCVLVTFVDEDFRTNLSRLKSGKETVNTTLKSQHSIDFGIITGIVYRKGE